MLHCHALLMQRNPSLYLHIHCRAINIFISHDLLLEVRIIEVPLYCNTCLSIRYHICIVKQLNCNDSLNVRLRLAWISVPFSVRLKCRQRRWNHVSFLPTRACSLACFLAPRSYVAINLASNYMFLGLSWPFCQKETFTFINPFLSKRFPIDE